MSKRMEEVEVCEACGMMYMAGVKKDQAAHRTFHDQAINGVKVMKNVRFDTVIFKEENVEIAQVSHRNSREVEKRIAERVALLVKKASSTRDFTWSGYSASMRDRRDRYQIYLYRIDNRIAGLLTLRFLSGSTLSHWAQELTSEDKEERWCIDYVWVAKGWRREGLARYLLTEAASHIGTTPHLMSWTLPFTESGLALVKSFCPKQFYFR